MLFWVPSTHVSVDDLIWCCNLTYNWGSVITRVDIESSCVSVNVNNVASWRLCDFDIVVCRCYFCYSVLKIYSDVNQPTIMYFLIVFSPHNHLPSLLSICLGLRQVCTSSRALTPPPMTWVLGHHHTHLDNLELTTWTTITCLYDDLYHQYKHYHRRNFLGKTNIETHNIMNAHTHEHDQIM